MLCSSPVRYFHMISRSQFSSLHRGPLAPRSPIVKPTPGSNRNSMQQARGLEICTIRSCPPEPAVQQTAGVRSSFAVSFLPRPDPGTRWTQVARKFDSLLEVMQQRSTAVRTTPQSTFKLPVNRRRWTHLKKGTKKRERRSTEDAPPRGPLEQLRDTRCRSVK